MPRPRRRLTDKLLCEWFVIDAWTGSRGFSLPMEARGLYREMLTQAWRRGAKLPNNEDAIRRITGCSEKEWKRCWPKVKHWWIEDGQDATHLVNVTQVVIYLQSKEAADRSVSRASAGGKAAAQAQLEKRVSAPPAPPPAASASEPRPPARTGSGAMVGGLPRDHARHVVCGRSCLHEKQFAEFVVKLGWELDRAKVEVRRWAEGIAHAWTEGARRTETIQGTTWQFWNARYEEWQGSPTAVKPVAQVAGRPPAHGSNCPHNPMCARTVDCIAKTIAEGRAEKAARA